MSKKMITVLLSVVILSSSFALMIGGCNYMVGSVMSQDNSLGFDIDTGEETLGMVKIEGVIMNSMPVIEQLQKLSQNSNVKGILIRVNSPGGAVGASQEIMDYISKIRKSGVPVVASYANVAASGGLYSTLTVNKIFANAGTITGSVGVIMQFWQGKELVKKIGVDMVTFKSGELKDAGSPFREVTSNDEAYFQGVIDETYQQFIEAVLENRKMEKDSLMKYADGRILTGSQAYKIGLIDSIGGFDVALESLAKLAGFTKVPSKLKEVKPKKSFIKQILDEPVSEIKKSLVPSSKIMFMMP